MENYNEKYPIRLFGSDTFENAKKEYMNEKGRHIYFLDVEWSTMFEYTISSEGYPYWKHIGSFDEYVNKIQFPATFFSGTFIQTEPYTNDELIK